MPYVSFFVAPSAATGDASAINQLQQIAQLQNRSGEESVFKGSDGSSLFAEDGSNNSVFKGKGGTQGVFVDDLDQSVFVNKNRRSVLLPQNSDGILLSFSPNCADAGTVNSAFNTFIATNPESRIISFQIIQQQATGLYDLFILYLLA